MLATILIFLGQVIAVGGGAAVIAYALFTWFGKKWIEDLFARRLEAYKREQNIQLEHFKHQINALFNRITKIHEKEIEILPVAWGKLQLAHRSLAYFTSPMGNHLEISQMNEQQHTEFRREFDHVSKCVQDFHDYLQDNSIFLSSDLYTEFMAADKLLSTAVVKGRIAREGLARERLTLEVYKEVYEDLDPIKERIRDLVQKRLHYNEAA